MGGCLTGQLSVEGPMIVTPINAMLHT